MTVSKYCVTDCHFKKNKMADISYHVEMTVSKYGVTDCHFKKKKDGRHFYRSALNEASDSDTL